MGYGSELVRRSCRYEHRKVVSCRQPLCRVVDTRMYRFIIGPSWHVKYMKCRQCRILVYLRVKSMAGVGRAGETVG